jgi:gamma-glutamyl-gamma-aminobutyraldehyde dehydrogenase
MSLLTTEEYKAIAAGLTFPTTAFIDGHFRPAISGKTFDTVNPATGDVLAKVAACGPEDVDLRRQPRPATPSRMAAGRACIRKSARKC